MINRISKHKSACKKVIHGFGAMIWWGLVAVILTMQSPSNLLTEGNSYTDSSVFRYIAYEWSQGSIPYVDTFDHKGPLLYFINMLGMKLGYTHGIWILEILALCFSMWLSCYMIKKYTTNRHTAIITVLIAYSLLGNLMDGGNNVEEWAIPFLTISLLVFWNYFEEHVSRIQIYIAGICFGCVLMLRPNMVVMWVAGGIAVLIDIFYSKKWNIVWQTFVYFFLGTISIVTPVIVYFIYNGAIREFWDCYIAFNIRYSSGGLIEKIRATVYVMNQIPIYFTLIISGYYVKSVGNTKRKKFMMLLIGILALSIVSIGMSGRFYAHYQMILIPVMLVPLAIFLDECLVNMGAHKKCSRLKI